MYDDIPVGAGVVGSLSTHMTPPYLDVMSITSQHSNVSQRTRLDPGGYSCRASAITIRAVVELAMIDNERKVATTGGLLFNCDDEREESNVR